MGALKDLAEVGTSFLRLGLTSFGGPFAHIGYFRREFVARRRWLDDAAFADLVALCQFLPGPASSQVAFGIGMRRAGPAGGVLASVAFLLPSAVGMILFAYGVASMGPVPASGWLHGLRLAAVGVVALAVWEMARRLWPDWFCGCLGGAAALTVLVVPGALGPVGVIIACGAAGGIARRGERGGGPQVTLRAGHAWAGASLVLCGILLVVLPLGDDGSGPGNAAVFGHFYRAGALVFGGGHVVLPLLRSAVVQPGWVGDRAFLAGYGAAQALPGPLFAFAGYLGTLVHAGAHRWLGGVWALVAIFLPGWLLVGGAWHLWPLLRERAWARGLVAGANAGVVGLLLAALYRPLCTESIGSLRDGAAAVAAALLVGPCRVPPWVVVAVMAAVGQWLLR